eukprot:3407943-Lingulodinium_polyedra.AAC.1
MFAKRMFKRNAVLGQPKKLVKFGKKKNAQAQEGEPRRVHAEASKGECSQPDNKMVYPPGGNVWRNNARG